MNFWAMDGNASSVSNSWTYCVFVLFCWSILYGDSTGDVLPSRRPYSFNGAFSVSNAIVIPHSGRMTVHYNDIIMSSIMSMASQITSLAIVYPFIQCADQRNIKALHHWPLWGEFTPVAGEFPTQRASNAENVSIWWRHHETMSSFVQIMVCCMFNIKPLSEQMLTFCQLNPEQQLCSWIIMKVNQNWHSGKLLKMTYAKWRTFVSPINVISYQRCLFRYFWKKWGCMDSHTLTTCNYTHYTAATARGSGSQRDNRVWHNADFELV